MERILRLSFGGAWRAIGGIFEWRSQRSGMLTTNFAEAGGFIRSRPDEAAPDLQLHFVIGKLVDHGRKTVFGHGYLVPCVRAAAAQPRQRGLASADPLAAPLHRPGFLSDPDDIERMVRGVKLMRRMLQQPALAAFGGPRAAGLGRRADRRRRSSSSSATTPTPSTTRWAAAAWARAGDDVVDERLRVHGLQGCAWSTRRSCRASSRATPMRRRS
jgi:choline dehydrogenase-like flavoprotein